VRRPIGAWHVVAVDLWYAPGRALAAPANAGLPRALALLARAATAHPEAVRLVDTTGFAEFERWQVYARHAGQCGAWGYALAEVFGSRSRAGSHAGLGVPLLSVRFREAAAPCVAPHRDMSEPGHRLRSALDLLGMLAPWEQARLFGEPV
jgi:hypothetical protein